MIYYIDKIYEPNDENFIKLGTMLEYGNIYTLGLKQFNYYDNYELSDIYHNNIHYSHEYLFNVLPENIKEFLHDKKDYEIIRHPIISNLAKHQIYAYGITEQEVQNLLNACESQIFEYRNLHLPIFKLDENDLMYLKLLQ